MIFLKKLVNPRGSKPILLSTLVENKEELMARLIDAVDVFAYQDYRQFLKDYYVERRKRDRKFSIRFFARRAGLRSQNYLKVVMDGRRSLTSRNMPKFVRGLGLDSSQA